MFIVYVSLRLSKKLLFLNAHLNENPECNIFPRPLTYFINKLSFRLLINKTIMTSFHLDLCFYYLHVHAVGKNVKLDNITLLPTVYTQQIHKSPFLTPNISQTAKIYWKHWF